MENSLPCKRFREKKVFEAPVFCNYYNADDMVLFCDGDFFLLFCDCRTMVTYQRCPWQPQKCLTFENV